MALTAGTRLGSCQIVAPPGSGGMGEVYRARAANLDRDVAIKVLPQHLTADPDDVALAHGLLDDETSDAAGGTRLTTHGLPLVPRLLGEALSVGW